MKKFLSLVLALVMTMSLVTISAGAADFTDESTIKYNEALDVISTLDIVGGYPDGSFQPQKTLTRAEAAKIICNMILGPTTAAALSADTAPFSDVPATHWAAGYIAYCAQQGIINGYGNGVFGANDTLTGYQFMKMLLTSLGYDAQIEGYVGVNYSVPVAKQALAIGLNDGNEDFNGNGDVTREEACLYAFNTLQADMVDYDARTSVTVGGAEVVIAGSKAETVAQGTYKNTMGEVNLQFAEKYFGKLTKTEGTDDFGRPATTWRFKGSKIDTYADTADKTYKKNVKLGDIYADLGMTEKDDEAEVFINGLAGDKVSVAKNNTAKISDKNTSPRQNYGKVGDGSTVEVFYDSDTNNVRICVIDTYVGTIVKSVAATSAKDAYVIVGYDNTARAARPATITLAGKDEFTTDEVFEDDAVVLYTYSDETKEIKSVKLAESVKGLLTKIVSEDELTVGDKEYPYAKNYTFDPVISNEAGLKTNNEYTVYLDEYGNYIYIVEEEFVSSDYAMIVGIENTNGAFTTNRVKLLGADGVTRIYNTDKNYMTAPYNYDASTIVTYKVREDGTAALKKVNTTVETLTEETPAANQRSVQWNNDIASGSSGAVNNGDTAFALNKNDAKVVYNTAGNFFYANSKTVFVVRDKNGDYTTYTGITNVPTIKPLVAGTDKIGVSFYCRTTNLATVVFIDAARASIVNSSKDVIFLAGESASNMTTDVDGNVYYTYNAVVKGEVTKVTVQVNANTIADLVFETDGDGVDDVTKNNLVFSGATYDSDGFITDFTVVGQGTVSTNNYTQSLGSITRYDGGDSGTVKLSGDYTIGTGSASSPARYTVAKDAKIWTINSSGKIAAAELNDIKTDAANVLTYTMEDGELTNIFVQLPDDTNVVSPEGGVAVNLTNITYSNPTLTVTLSANASVATNYAVAVYQINGGAKVKLADYTVTVAAGTRTGTANIGNLPAGSTYLAECGGMTFGL